MTKQVIRNKRQGRSIQSKIAKQLGGKNVGTIEGQDVEHPLLSGEVKHRVKFLGNTFMQQCIKNCPVGKIPVVVVHQKYQKLQDSLVLLRLSDFQDLFGDITIKDKENDETNS